MIKKLITGGAVLASGAAIWGVAGQDHTQRNDTGSIVAAGELGAFVTKLGDCFDGLPTVEGTGVSTVQGIPCSSPHHFQVVYKGTLSLPSFDESSVHDAASQLCSNAIRNIVNNMTLSTATEYQNAESSDLRPTAASWDKGDRAVDCLVGSYSETYSDSLL
jgi:hypothetical protein